MAKLNIVDVHGKCLNFLLEYQRGNEGFYFVPRQRNNDRRLEQGMWFIGSMRYMQISFWIGQDHREKIHNIAFVIHQDNECFLEISSCDDDSKAHFLMGLIKILGERAGLEFKKFNGNKWTHCFNDEVYDEIYLDELLYFIENVKPIIDKYLSETESGIKFPDKKFDDKYVKSLRPYIDFVKLEKENKNKKTGTIAVKPTEHTRTLKHNELSNKLTEYLKNNSYTSCYNRQ